MRTGLKNEKVVEAHNRLDHVISNKQLCDYFDPLWNPKFGLNEEIHLKFWSICVIFQSPTKALTFDQKWIKGCFSIRKVNQKIDPLFRKPKKDFEPSGKTEITFEGVELIRNDEIFRDQGQGSTDIFNCLLSFYPD